MTPVRAILLFLMLHAAVTLARPAQLAPAARIEAITFAIEPTEVYAPLTEISDGLRWTFGSVPDSHAVMVNGVVLEGRFFRRFTDGSPLLSVAGMVRAGAQISAVSEPPSVMVRYGRRAVILYAGAKRVEITLEAQVLRAWQGSRLVLESRISSGRRGSTPAGEFRAGPFKARRHYSSRYDNAAMPWSVQVNGHVFIHGFTSVPNYPASHGCIRLPLTDGNPAKFFYEWVDVGTPVRITSSPAERMKSP
jgi:hypothetical protein